MLRVICMLPLAILLGIALGLAMFVVTFFSTIQIFTGLK